MELSFIVSALRRYFWVVIACALLGAVPGLLRPEKPGGLFESRAVLIIASSTDSRVQSSSGEPDRYITGQLSVLRSEALAARVAERMTAERDEEYTAAGVQDVVEFAHQSGTDIADIEVATPEPALSQAIGNAYIEEYFEALREQADDALAPEINQLNDQISDVRSRLRTVDQQLADAVRPYLPVGPAPGGDSAPPIPGLEQIAPDLVSERQILLTELEGAASTLSQLQTSARLRVASEVVQRATLPGEPEPAPPNRLLIVGVVGGAFVGVLVAVVLARLSSRVLDDGQAADILGQPIVGAFPASRVFARSRRAVVEDLPANVAPFVNGLSVRAELDHGSGSLTVVVVGTRAGAGSTTLAGAIANRFATHGASVLLVDADPRHPELSTLFSVDRSLQRTGTDAASVDGPQAMNQAHLDGVIRPTAVAGLFVARAGEETLRRPQNVVELFEQIQNWADVTVYDGGPLLASASTVQLSRLCDTVVLAVPRRQSIRGLNAVARTLQQRDFLPVWMPVVRRPRPVGRRAGGRSERDAEELQDELLITAR